VGNMYLHVWLGTPSPIGFFYCRIMSVRWAGGPSWRLSTSLPASLPACQPALAVLWPARVHLPFQGWKKTPSAISYRIGVASGRATVEQPQLQLQLQPRPLYLHTHSMLRPWVHRYTTDGGREGVRVR